MHAAVKNSHSSRHNKKAPMPGYYWRDYNGEIPCDAVPGGHDINKRPTYIGQAYFSKFGVIPGTIHPGQMGIRMPHSWKVHYSDIGVKILCATNWNCFSWEPADSKTLHTSTIGKHLVIGGYENGRNMLNIGRVLHQGELVIGKVIAYTTGNIPLHIVSGDKEIGVNSYEVLVYYH